MRFATTSLIALCVAAPAAADVPRVVTDIPAVHSLAAQVMGDLGSPELLLDRGADPHAFQLRPSQAAGLSKADVVFWVGEELTPWLARSLESLSGEAQQVSLLAAEDVTLRTYEKDAHDDHDHGHDHGHAHDHGHGHDDDHADDHSGDAVDPHAWLDPSNAEAWLRAIAQTLSDLDPDNAATYAANAETASASLAETRAAVEARLGDGLNPIVVFHDAYGYFEAAFGVDVAGSIALGDAAAPGAGRLRELAEIIEHDNVACVFREPQHDGAIAESVARDAGVELGLLDPLGSTIEPGPELYGTLLMAMAAEIAECGSGRG